MVRMNLRPLFLALTLTAASMTSAMAQTDGASGQASTEALIAAREFGAYCSVCHGLEGRGDGPAAPELKTPPADLTKISERNGGEFPRQYVYKAIQGFDMPRVHGTSEMPIWGAIFEFQATANGVLVDDVDSIERISKIKIDRLVNYLETIQE